jgi:hypothetical protein
MEYLVAAIAESHGAAILHYDADFDRLAEYTDLAVDVEALHPWVHCPDRVQGASLLNAGLAVGPR